MNISRTVSALFSLIAIMVSLQRISVHADEVILNAKWSGEGQIHSDGGPVLNCNSVTLELDETMVGFFIDDFWMGCSDKAHFWLPLALEIRNGPQLWFKDERVGDIQELFFNFSLDRTGQSMKFVMDESKCRATLEAAWKGMTFTGTLIKD